MKRRIIPLIILLAMLYAGRLAAQDNIKAYVKKNIVPLKTVEPDSTGFSDLEVIGNAIGDASVVMLGEEDHGDAPTFLAKTRLIKYLHEKKGFNVLAFESDFFGLNYGWDRLPKTHPVMDNFIMENVFGVWTVCDACNTLFYHYIPATYQTSTPLVLTGFDSQQYLDYSFHNLAHVLDSTLRSLNLPVTKQNDYPAMIKLLDSSKKWMFVPPKDTSRVAGYFRTLLFMKKQLAASVGPDNFWLPVVDGLIEQASDFRKRAATGKIVGYGRDVQMARNLEWLVENKFKGQKIIVWAADYHIARAVGNFKQTYYNDGDNMGSRFARDGNAGQKVYLLGFTSFSGRAGRIGMSQYEVSIPFKNSFERWVPKDYPYAFINFNPYNTANPQAGEYFYMAGFGHMDMEACWNHVFDGVIFIRDMYPCNRLKPF